MTDETLHPASRGGPKDLARSSGGPARSHGRARNRRTATFRGENTWGYLFLTPWFVGLVGLTLGPILASLYLSFTDFDLFTAPRWVGLDNYVRLFTDDPRYLTSLRVTITYVFLSVPLKLVFALFLAIVLKRGMRAVGIYRAVYYVPSLLGGSVAIAVLWRQVFGAEGLVNNALAFLGVQNAPNWLANPDTSLYTLVALAVWEFGAPMVIFLAGLQQIPQEYYEASAIDGAGRLRQFRNVTLPLLTPIIFFNLVMQIIGAFKIFTPAFVISGGDGGPSDSTLFYTLYLYQEGFTHFRMGYASAMAWLLLAIIAVFTAVNFLTSRYWVHYQAGPRR